MTRRSRSCFPQEKLAGRFKGAAPFDLPQRAALGAKLLAPLLEAHHHPLKVVLVGFAQLDVSSHERLPQRATGNPDKGGLEAVGQADREFNSLFRIVLDVDVDHQCRKGHRIFLFALIDDARPFHIPSASVFSRMLSATTCNRPGSMQEARV